MKYAGRTARRYARALFATADEAGVLEAVVAEMAMVAATLAEHADLHEALASRHLPDERKVSLIEQIFRAAAEGPEEEGDATPSGRISDLTFDFLRLLIRNRRFDLVGQIDTALAALLDQRQGVVRAKVTTAVPLLKAEREMIVEKLEQITGARQVELETRVTKTIIGGLVVHVGTHVIDASVRTYLATMRDRLRRVKVSDLGSDGILRLDLQAIRAQIEGPADG